MPALTAAAAERSPEYSFLARLVLAGPDTPTVDVVGVSMDPGSLSGEVSVLSIPVVTTPGVSMSLSPMLAVPKLSPGSGSAVEAGEAGQNSGETRMGLPLLPSLLASLLLPPRLP